MKIKSIFKGIGQVIEHKMYPYKEISSSTIDGVTTRILKNKKGKTIEETIKTISEADVPPELLEVARQKQVEMSTKGDSYFSKKIKRS